MRIELVGLNHRTAPIEVRERLAVRDEQLGSVLDRLRAEAAADEAVVLSTCNRVEVYAAGEAEALSPASLAASLAAVGGIPLHMLRPHLYFHTGRAVVRHLFAVAAGLDSMVVGEPQVLGQVKQAYLAAVEHQATGKVLNALFQAAIKVGKAVRSETQLAEGRVSVSSVAVELAESIFGRLTGRTVLVLGGGDMAEQALLHLVESGASTTLVANRTLERAKALAERHGGQAVPYDQFGERLADADVVIVSTGAPHYVLTEDRLREALRRRRNTPLLVIDIAVPRNVDPAAAKLDNIFLYDIDDLETVVSRNRAERERAVTEAFALIERHVAAFAEQLGVFAVEPLIAGLDQHAGRIRDAELERVLAKLAHLSEADKEAIRRAAERLVNRLLHRPKVALRKAAAEGRHQGLAELLTDLFPLDEPPEPPQADEAP